MRLDKYLKVSRLIKRRTVANEACDGGRVTVNGQVATELGTKGDPFRCKNADGGGRVRHRERGQGRGCGHVQRGLRTNPA